MAELTFSAPEDATTSSAAAHEAGTTSLDDAGNHSNNVVAGQLPPEIRNLIYKLVLTKPENVPTRGRRPVVLLPTPTSRDVTLLLVSRQTYLEAMQLFYRFKKLRFITTYLLYRFLKNIGEARRKEITQVAFLWTSHSPHANEAFDLLRTCSSLRSVEIVVFPDVHEVKGWWGKPILKRVRGMQTVTFRGYKSGSEVDGPAIQEMKTAMMRPRQENLTAQTR